MNPIYVLVARLLLGAIWLIAAISKFLQITYLEGHFRAFGLPPLAARGVARSLPWVELALGALLLLGKWTSVNAAISAFLLCLFSIAVIANLLRGRAVECHCFGQLSRGKVSWFSVLRNILLIVAALFIRQASFYAVSLDRWGRDQLPPHVVPSDFIPVLLMTLAGLLAVMLSASAWQAAQTIVWAEEGPATGMPERLFLQRWFRMRSPTPSAEKRK